VRRRAWRISGGLRKHRALRFITCSRSLADPLNRSAEGESAKASQSSKWIARDEADRGDTMALAAPPQRRPQANSPLSVEIVDPFSAIVAHAAREGRRFPRRGRDFKAGELLQDFGDAARAFETVFFVDVLPSRRGNGGIAKR